MKLTNLIRKLNIKNYTTYGDDMAKVDEHEIKKMTGKLVLVTAISPTKSGNGKTTVSIGLAEAINRLGRTCSLSLREPSMGPVFGLKGGATGGGKSVVTPSDKINLHFTGDMHAITAANNLICACVDNAIYQESELDIDPENIFISRCLDCNDRALRNVTIGDKNHRREEHFVITPASEIMAILCLSQNFEDLHKNIGNLVVALSKRGKPITVRDMGIADAVTGLMSNAINPNFVQTMYGTPAFVHGGPFANIAHGASTIIATKMALSHSEFAVTEAGFGADLGAEKFFDVVCKRLGKYPDVVVLIATMPALKTHGDGDYKKGLENLQKHMDNLHKTLGANLVVTVNKFTGDSEKEIADVIAYCEKQGVPACKCNAYNEGPRGAKALAELVVKASEKKSKPHSLYNEKEVDTKKQIEMIAKEIYGAGKVTFSEKAAQKLKFLKKYGYDHLPTIIAKTQYSLTADQNILGAPKGFEFPITDIEIRTGAGFVVAVCGKQMLMPALPKVPNANKMTLNGKDLTGV